jgi:hypothetical protein
MSAKLHIKQFVVGTSVPADLIFAIFNAPTSIINAIEKYQRLTPENSGLGQPLSYCFN